MGVIRVVSASFCRIRGPCVSMSSTPFAWVMRPTARIWWRRIDRVWCRRPRSYR